MANAQFLSDLSSGIFDRLGQLRDEQTRKDESRRGEALQFLGSLAEKIEPESLPVLMRTMADIGNFKGKVGTFWNALSGMPDRSVEDRIGTGLREAMGMTIGSQTAKGLRGRAVADLATGSFTSPQTLDQAAGLTGKMVIRDPFQQKLEEIERRYSGQFANQQALASYKEGLMTKRMTDLETQRQQDRVELEREKGDIQAERKIREKAFLNARGQGRGYLTGADWSVGVKSVAKELGLNEELLRARIGLTGARTEEARATAQSLKETGGLKPSDVDRRLKNFLTARESLTKSEGIVKGITDQKSGLVNKINQLMNIYPGYKFRYDPDKKEVVIDQSPPGTTPENERVFVGLAAKRASKEIEQHGELSKTLKEESDKAEGFRKSMEEYKAQQPGKPQRPEAPRPGPRAGMSTTKGTKYFRSNNPDKYEVGKSYRDANGRTITVVGIGPGGEIYYK